MSREPREAGGKTASDRYNRGCFDRLGSPLPGPGIKQPQY